MAKKSSVEKNNRRRKLSEQYAKKRAELKAQALNEAAAGAWPGWDHLGVLVAWTVLLTAAASRWFRWE